MTPTSNNSLLPAVPTKHKLQQSADTAAAATADDDDLLMMTTMITMMMTIQLTTLPPTRAHHHIPEPRTHHLNHPHNNDLTTHWIRNAFDPVFQALDCLAENMADLSDILAEVIKNLSQP